MANLRRIAIFAATFFLLFTGLASAQTSSVGTVSSVIGSAAIDRSGVRRALSAGTAIQPGDVLTTDPASNITVNLADGSRLELAESSSLIITDSLVSRGRGSSTKLFLNRGRVRAAVQNVFHGIVPGFEI